MRCIPATRSAPRISGLVSKASPVKNRSSSVSWDITFRWAASTTLLREAPAPVARARSPSVRSCSGMCTWKGSYAPSASRASPSPQPAGRAKGAYEPMTPRQWARSSSSASEASSPAMKSA